MYIKTDSEIYDLLVESKFNCKHKYHYEYASYYKIFFGRFLTKQVHIKIHVK